MNLKKIKIIGIFVIFLLCFPFHFAYDFLPNSITSIFFPVNESIWEHMKLIFTSFLVYSLIEYLVLKKYSIDNNNFLFQTWFTPIIGIIIYLFLFLPLYRIFGENMIISLSLLFIVIIIEQIISYHFLLEKEIKYQNIIGIIGIILTYILFGYLTYNPPISELFYDIKDNKYGINTYVKK